MASLEEHYKEFLTCQICFNIFNIPKSLPCLHVFCQGCLDHWMAQSSEGGQFQCPACRAYFPKTKDGAADFMTNFHMNSMVDALKNVLNKDGTDTVKVASFCDICKSSGENVTAEHRCIECDEKLCQPCGKTHRHSKLTKSHQVIDLTGDEFKDAQAIINVISTKNVYCPKHKEETVKFFCTNDNEALCQVCFVTAHASHNCEDINESAKSKLQEVAKLIELAMKREKRFENSINRTNNVLKAVDKAANKVQQDAKDDQVITQAVLVEHYDSLEGGINEMKMAKVKALQAHVESLQLQKGIAETTRLQMMSLQQHGHPVEVVNMATYITSKVQEWSKSFNPDEGSAVDEPIGIELYPSRIQDLQMSLANLPYEDIEGSEDDDVESIGESVGESVEDAAESLDQLDVKDEKEYLGPVHRGINCDICSGKIQGVRFKCMVCPEFNLCSTCGSKWGNHRHHDMIRIHNPIGKRGRRGWRFQRGGRGSRGAHPNQQGEMGLQHPGPQMLQGPPMGGNQGGHQGGQVPRGGFQPRGPYHGGLHLRPSGPHQEPGGPQQGSRGAHFDEQQLPQRGGREGFHGRGGPANRGGRGGHSQGPATPQSNIQQMPSGSNTPGGEGGKKKKQHKKGGKN